MVAAGPAFADAHLMIQLESVSVPNETVDLRNFLSLQEHAVGYVALLEPV